VAALGELEQWRRPECWPEPQVKALLETAPRWSALVLLELEKPVLGDVLQVVGGHPDLLLRHGALLAKIGLAPVDEHERIRLAIVAGKVEFLESR
jgi:hypothetical protein